MSLVGTFLLFYPRFASPSEIYLTLLLFVAISSECCRYFLAHVACRNLPWQGLFHPFVLCAPSPLHRTFYPTPLAPSGGSKSSRNMAEKENNSSFSGVSDGCANKYKSINPITGESDEPILVGFEDVSAAAYRIRNGVKKHVT